MIEKIQELLHEEKWTRATINSYSVHNFTELAEIVEQISEDNLLEIKDMCDEHLVHTKNSIIALYISGIISQKKHFIDDSNLLQLINLFYDNRKWNIVEHLCNETLSFGENRIALRLLADCYDNQGKEDEKFVIWERLIKIDYEETDILKTLAEKYELEDNIEKAIDYYKKCMHRFINKRSFAQIKEIWGKFIEYIPEEYEYLLNINSRIQKGINQERAAQLLDDLYSYYSERQEWDRSIEILKLILSYQPNNTVARTSIIACFKEKYKDHSKLASYIERSNLTQAYRDIQTAIEEFEKHISFDQGTFVYHKTWGIGRIKSLKNESLVIDFASKRNHPMTLKMSIKALKVLPKNHIWVIKSIFPKEKLKEKVKKDIPWALRTVVLSFDNSLSLKKIKAELVPSILTPNEWLSWNNNAKKILKTDPLFSINPDSSDEYMVRSTPITYDEKTLNIFKGEKDIYHKIKIVKDFLENSDPESDYFAEVFSFFTGILKSFSSINDTVVACYLYVMKLMKQYPFLSQNLEISFKDLYNEIDHVDALFNAINDTELKKCFLEEVKNNFEQWPQIYKDLFKYYQSSYILDMLFNNKQRDVALSIFTNAYSSYKEDPETCLWLIKNYSKDFWIDKVGISYDRLIISMLHMLDISYRAIENKKEVSKNRKLSKNIYTIMFEDGELLSYFRTCDVNSVQRIYPLVNEISDLAPARKIEIKHIIKERFPEYLFQNDSNTTSNISGGLLVTMTKLKDKEEELRYLSEVAIPENSKEIGDARLLGDLKENAEYIAGKEKQELLNIAIGKLKEELSKAVVFNPEETNTSKISFGTRVVLFNRKAEKNETIIILGPWESDPKNNIISYLAPFGAALIAHTVGEHLEFTINERDYSYDVVSIEKYLD
jgi:transcription elongation factor GreA